MDRIKIRFSRPKFIHKKNVTICMMTFCVGELNYYSRVKGISKCKEGDTYDERVGERIAQARAEIAARNEVKEVVMEEIRKTAQWNYQLNRLVDDIKIFNSHDRDAIKEFIVEE